jgi:enoyl-CoA hydratase/carnithine racemase
VREIEGDPTLRSAVILGSGGLLYTVGADIREMEPCVHLVDRQEETVRWLTGVHAVLDQIERSSKVDVCAMKGISYGGRLEIAGSATSAWQRRTRASRCRR